MSETITAATVELRKGDRLMMDDDHDDGIGVFSETGDAAAAGHSIHQFQRGTGDRYFNVSIPNGNHTS